MSDPARNDPFGTAALRQSVINGWTASPTRFREDANVEEDFARDAYRDRLIVELAQNAADAAAGSPGRLLLHLGDTALVASNTGRPLDLDGVQALAAMRASAKRDASTAGRFGVGFAAVLAVTDEPVVVSRNGGVRFSAEATGAAVADIPHLAQELGRRSGHLPVLRLPFAVDPAEISVADGYDTTVVLPLRDDDARRAVQRLLDELDASLLLALPALREIAIETPHGSRTLRALRSGDVVEVSDDSAAESTTTKWHVIEQSGPLDSALLNDRPVEERQRPTWSVLWAVPVENGRPVPLPPGVPAVLHAPTSSDEPIGLSGLLVATLPMDPSRRHVAPGPLAAWIAEQAANGYADLVQRLLTQLGAPALQLVPAGPAAGALDATLREHVLAVLGDRPLVPLADEPGRRVVARDAARLAPSGDEVVTVLAQAYAGLADPAWAAARAAMTALGSPLVPLADVLDAVGAVKRPASWWHSLYEALDAAGIEREVLDGLPVLLADGRLRRGARGLVMSDGQPIDVALAEAAELSVVDADAEHPLLVRLGAQPADPLALLQLPSLLDAVSHSVDRHDPEPLAVAVLELVASAGGGEPDDRLADLALATSDGGWARAGSLVLPGSALADLLDEPLCVHPGWVQRFGESALRGVGVADTFPVRRHSDVSLEPEAVSEVFADGDAWVDWVLDQLPNLDFPPLLPELVVVDRLDQVRDDAWPQALQLLVAPSLRDAVVNPVRVLLPDGRAVDVVSPTAWWLRDAPVFGGVAPVDLRLPRSDPLLVGLYDDAPASVADVDPALLHALGVRRGLGELLAEDEGADELLERLAEPRRRVRADQLNALYAALSALSPDRWPQPPARVRVPDDAGSRVVDADEVTVVLSPLHRPLVSGTVLPGDGRLAELLDVDSSEALGDAEVESSGVHRSVDPVVSDLMPDAATQWWEHDDLVVGGHRVDGWVDRNGGVHAATVDGLAAALCWATGHWSSRHEVAAVLAEPSRLSDVLTQRAYDSWGDADDGDADDGDADDVEPRR